MSKKNIVSRILSVHQEHELLMKLENAGLSKEGAQLVIDSKNNELAREMVAIVEAKFVKAISIYDNIVEAIYDIVVDYNRSLNAMIKAGKYDWVRDDINTKHFPLKGKGKHELKAVLLHFNRYIEFDDAIAEMDRQGYRPGNIEELLALGEQYPDLQKRFPIVALGSVWWVFDHTVRLMPFLKWSDLDRDINLCSPWSDLDRDINLCSSDGGWYAESRFLAFRK